MGDEAALGRDIRLLEPADGAFGGANIAQNVGVLVGVRVEHAISLCRALCNATNVSAKSRISAGKCRMVRPCKHTLLALPCSSAR